MAFGFWQGLLRARARKAFPIHIVTPPFTPRSGGVRALYLLCDHLNRLGYNACAIVRPVAEIMSAPPGRPAAAASGWHGVRRREPIVVYPEVVAGNPEGARFVVRYLLNKPGLLAPGVESTFGSRDYFLHGAPEHVPAGVGSFDLFMPLVDHSIYFPPPAGTPRAGFAAFSHRVRPDPANFPDWLKPCTVLSMQSPRSHAELGELYRRSRAMVTWERSSAIFEALSCGCPVVCIDGEHFNEKIYQPRFRGAGLIWGWRQDEIAAAAGRTPEFRAIYRDLENSLDERIALAFDSIIEDARCRIDRADWRR